MIAGHELNLYVVLPDHGGMTDEAWKHIVMVTSQKVSEIGFPVIVSQVDYEIVDARRILQSDGTPLIYPDDPTWAAKVSMNVRKVGDPYAPLW